MTIQRASKPPKYTGELAEPIYEPLSVGLLGDYYNAEVRRRAFERQSQKMLLLIDLLKIDMSAEHCWIKLSFALAEAHVPGMRIVHDRKPRRGRQRSWQAGLGTELLRDVAVVMAQEPKGTTFETAIQHLREDKSKDWKKYTRANLLTRHREARKAEQKRKRLIEALALPPGMQPMGGLFGLGAAVLQPTKKHE
ncbi:MAG: hypothetical protein Q7S85_06455 [Rugosibacter sp.]|nr:hypothetical protein [Rugosibacter sp.]